MKEIINYIIHNNSEYIKCQNKNTYIKNNIYNAIDTFCVKFNKNLKEFNFIYI